MKGWPTARTSCDQRRFVLTPILTTLSIILSRRYLVPLVGPDPLDPVGLTRFRIVVEHEKIALSAFRLVPVLSFIRHAYRVQSATTNV